MGEGYQDVTRFFVIIGPDTTAAPLGPDAYGYFAYDDTDLRYGEAPTYGWVEIDTGYGGAGTLVE